MEMNFKIYFRRGMIYNGIGLVYIIVELVVLEIVD